VEFFLKVDFIVMKIEWRLPEAEESRGEEGTGKG
jgi:hypothetical protein